MYNQDSQASHAPLETSKFSERLEVFAGTVMTALLAVIVLILLTVQPAHGCSPTVVKGLLPTDNRPVVVEIEIDCAQETPAVSASGYDQLRHVYENGHVSAQALQSMHAANEEQDTTTATYEELVRRAVESGMVPAEALQRAPTVANEATDTAATTYAELLRRAVESGMVPAEALQRAPTVGEAPATSPFRWISPADQLRYVYENGHVSTEVWTMAQDADRVATQPQMTNDLP